MSQEKTERQLNLVICLLATRRFLTAREIRATVYGYGRAESDAAFKRMFERDKKELREAGIPIETGGGDLWSDEEGYRISRADYELPPIELRADEAAVLGLAARAWRHAALGDVAADALLKLRAAGVPVDGDATSGITPVLGTNEPAFLPIWQAVRDRRPIVFDYRAPNRDLARRELEPWGVVNVNGHWYVAGYDRDRRDRRVFRLSRIVGEVRVVASGPAVQVPDGVDVRSVVSGRHGEVEQIATVLVRADSAHELRRGARRIVPGERSTGEPGWDLLEYPFTDVASLVGRVAQFGDRVVLREPAQARAAVEEHLRAVAEREPAAGTEPAPEPERAPDPQPRRGGTSSEQLRRLLMLVPYALSHDVRVSEVAAHFGLTEKQVLKDLGLLWMCGLPGYTPGDLIDVDLDAAQATGEIIIANADTLAAPLRLTADEAASLVVGVELLREMPGVASDALKRVGEKLRAAAGVAVDRLADAVEVRIEQTDEVKEVQRRAGDALRAGQRVHLRYLSGYQDQVTERDVDPMRLVVQDGHAFLEGWCRLRTDVRLFRLDRVLDLTVLPVAAEVPGHARERDLRGGLLQRSADDVYVTLDLAPGARWVTEEYVCTDLRELADGWLRATLRTPAPAWVRRLALRLGPQARVAAPAELAERVRADAARALVGY
ncbi:proteasome accessory factor B/proteasome accessory factor C [Spinactinospora alkalitolerans]|uniref:Proteasome accessory factor B/proteasome accessory factor C n=1 Tax=Spinactinospora alkalitolerans TaxID=687207 RepID=A0A852TVT9_9ACTN|nr:WYL domain-containing protein [Spinactinospora alkalitolerans]NYE46953.1 proteasome accessory factor B/proteasome accessory factor C [Spinactinospora alkalitolerans]